MRRAVVCSPFDSPPRDEAIRDHLREQLPLDELGEIVAIIHRRRFSGAIATHEVQPFFVGCVGRLRTQLGSTG